MSRLTPSALIKHITVIGSSNTDMSVKTQKIPLPGETVLGGKFFMNPGGKGANQAVAAARLGGNVTFIASTGNDVFGKEARERFSKEGIDTNYVFTDPDKPSGVALITVDDTGENCIVVAPGANGALLPEQLDLARAGIERSTIILMQLEIPIETIEVAASIAFEKRIPLVLNPAPACQLEDDLLEKVSIITPNQKEAEMLTGVKVFDTDSAIQAARLLHEKGIATVIITMSSEGALVLHEGEVTLIPALKVTPVDTTGAGDVFNGALVTALSEGSDMLTAVAFACKAAAISVTRWGAQASAPYRNELTNLIK